MSENFLGCTMTHAFHLPFDAHLCRFSHCASLFPTDSFARIVFFRLLTPSIGCLVEHMHLVLPVLAECANPKQDEAIRIRS